MTDTIDTSTKAVAILVNALRSTGHTTDLKVAALLDALAKERDNWKRWAELHRGELIARRMLAARQISDYDEIKKLRAELAEHRAREAGKETT